MIMAGGAGTRLWPMSRKELPKQLIKFIEHKGEKRPRSLLEIAAGQLVQLLDVELVVGGVRIIWIDIGRIRANIDSFGDDAMNPCDMVGRRRSRQGCAPCHPRLHLDPTAAAGEFCL